MVHRQPEGPPPPPAVQRLILQYAKRGPLRYTSARDLGRAIERGLRRAKVPMAYSAGFHPHPRLSYLSAAPTGAGSEAEYMELRLAEYRDPAVLARELDAVLPDGVVILTAVDGSDGLAARMATLLTASHWCLTWPDGVREVLCEAVEALVGAAAAPVTRPARGRKPERILDTRPAVINLHCRPQSAAIDLILQHQEPAVRPDDIATALGTLVGARLGRPTQTCRLAQGVWSGTTLTNPLHHRLSAP